MAYVLPEDLQQAKRMDLLTYLQTFEPQELVRVSGNTYCSTDKQAGTDIEILKAEKLRQYESYAEGIISKEDYIRKKERIAEKVKAAEQAIAEKNSTLQGDRAVTQSVEALMKTLSQFEEEPRLTQELSDIYVDAVYIYDTERVEVVLNNEDVIRGIIDRIQSKAGKR